MTNRQRDEALARVANGRSAHKPTVAHPLCTVNTPRGTSSRWLAGYCLASCPQHGSKRVYAASLRASLGDVAAERLLAMLDWTPASSPEQTEALWSA